MQDRDVVLRCDDLHHWFDRPVLYSIDLEIVRGEIVSLVGPSGCGKSTLLRAITGTHPPRKGRVAVVSSKNGEIEITVDRPTRDIGIVYQHYSLFPFLTAVENVAFGLMLDESTPWKRLYHWGWWRRLRKNHIEESAAMLERFGLAHAVNRYPHQLSGGMRQRVAIAQALIMKPEIVLLDEPFGALDEVTREEMQRMLLRLYLENSAKIKAGGKPPYTVLLVTHELLEALYVGDRVIGLSQYWNWKEEGHESFPGATIIYDKPAPVYHPDVHMDYSALMAQCHEVRKAVFDPAFLQERNEFRTFWKQVENGEGEGVLSG